MDRQWTFFFIFCLWINLLAGQSDSTDRLIKLAEVDIHAPRMLKWSTGQFVQQLDSSTLREYDSWSLSDLLLEHSGAFIKSYGPGALSGPSLRGGASGQTAVVWNGLNMQSAMNGQLDLSLIPVSMVQNFYIQHGGGSALFGSGAIGGSVHIHNRPLFGLGNTMGLKTTLGSFGKKALGGEVSISKKRFYSATLFFTDQSEGWIEHAAYKQKSLMQTLGVNISPKNKIWGQIWGQHFLREIPFSTACQEDALFRSHIEWNHTVTRWNASMRAAFVKENLLYEDTAVSIFSDNQALKSLFEAETDIYLNTSTSLHLGANYLLQRSHATAYDFISHRRDEQAVFISVKKSWLEGKWNSAINLRQAWVAGQVVPFMPSLGLEGSIKEKWRLHAHVSRNYRIPTFNDLYWQPGGNLDLLPESGWGQELGLRIEKQKIGKASMNSWLQLFNRQVNNWIIWLPGPAYWSPENVRRVWARGMEAGFDAKIVLDKWRFKTRMDYNWVKSTRQFSLSPQDAGENKQLIYVPEHQLKFFAKLSRHPYKLTYSHQLIGKRYTTTDNAYALPAYQLGNVKISYTVQYKRLNADAGFRIANLWNASYQIVAARPMPLRNYSLSLALYFQQKPSISKHL